MYTLLRCLGPPGNEYIDSYLGVQRVSRRDFLPIFRTVPRNIGAAQEEGIVGLASFVEGGKEDKNWAPEVLG